MKPAKIGFLPLYIELYDAVGSKARSRLEPFYETLVQALEARGLEVIRSPFCRLSEEFEKAISSFEAAGADCIVTWHAAYSPSLESAQALSRTALPIVVLDTTETYDFGASQNPDEISYCHGIHGVMDMCNLLNRNGKVFAIAAGHYSESDVLDRVAGFARAAAAAMALSGSKVGSIGGSFPGMGDFLVSDRDMSERFGVTVKYADAAELLAIRKDISEEDIRAEMAADLENCTQLKPVPEEVHRLTVRDCLTVRRWADKHGLAAFTVNFLEIRPENGLDTMPFMEACKAMARGIGYAGEGDVLTAAFTGALIRGFGDVTFTEIFCPDWKGDGLFLSHMGEINYRVSTRPELMIKPFPYTAAKDPVVGSARLRSGDAVFVNVFRRADGFALFAAPVTMLEPSGDAFAGNIRGWMKPAVPVGVFLEELSRAGATHHSTLVYGATVEQINFFSRILGLDVKSIG